MMLVQYTVIDICRKKNVKLYLIRNAISAMRLLVKYTFVSRIEVSFSEPKLRFQLVIPI